MKTIDAIIVDDEELGRKNLQKLLDDYCPEVMVRAMAGSAMEARQMVREHRPDLVFLDIHMPGSSGFDFLDGLSEQSFSTIFVTAYREYGIEALKAGAIDYLMKPVDYRELQVAVDKALQKLIHSAPSFGPQRILIHLAEGSFILKLSEILYIKADDNYSEFFLRNGQTRIVSMTLRKVRKAYPLDRFFRINNSVIINLEHVVSYTKVGGKEVKLVDGQSFPISRRRFSDFQEAVQEFVQVKVL